MKLAIVVGHNAHSQGAVRSDTGESEYQYNSHLATLIRKLGSRRHVEVLMFVREPGLGYTAEIEDVYKRVDAEGADASIELHFNSSGNPSASGTETFTSGSPKSVMLAEAVQMEMVEVLGLADRGIKIRNNRTKGRGYKSLVAGRAPAILIEPFFGSSVKGKAASDSEHERRMLAEAIFEGARKAMENF